MTCKQIIFSQNKQEKRWLIFMRLQKVIINKFFDQIIEKI